jgi:acyl carrier protein
MVPQGITGELYVGGPGLTRGYLGKPALTADRFVPDPFGSKQGQRLYRSGDLGFITSEGDIQYIGRLDHQVKIRGFRIELGEIESCIRLHPMVKEIAVLDRVERNRGCRLVAYLVAEKTISIDELRQFIKRSLPEYMVPQVFVTLSTLPLTTNGKLDRKTLFSMEVDVDRPTSDSRGPLTDLEMQIKNIWSKVLEVEDIGIDDNFFEIGGHSLLATRVVALIREVTQTKVSITDLFMNPTIAELVTLINESNISTQSDDASFMNNILADLEQANELENATR